MWNPDNKTCTQWLEGLIKWKLRSWVFDIRVKFQLISTRYNGSNMPKSTLTHPFFQFYRSRLAYFCLKMAWFTKWSTRREGKGSGSSRYVKVHQKLSHLNLVPSACRCVRPLGSNIETTLSIANFGPVWAIETYDTFLESSWKISKKELYYKSGTNIQPVTKVFWQVPKTV